MTAITAIETQYNGHVFRSRTEARWARFFDQIGVKWFYEHEGYKTSTGNYVPDFWLPQVMMRDANHRGVLFEVKPPDHPSEHMQLMEVADALGVSALLAKGFARDFGDWDGLVEIAPDWDEPMTMYVCKCGAVKFEFCEGSYMNCPICKRSDHDYSDHWIKVSYKQSLAHRFW